MWLIVTFLSMVGTAVGISFIQSFKLEGYIELALMVLLLFAAIEVFSYSLKKVTRGG